MSHNTIENISKMLSFLKLQSNLGIIGLLYCDEYRAIVEVIYSSFSSWLNGANEKSKKRGIMSAQHASENVQDPTDSNLNIKRVPVYYEQTNPFVL